MHTDLHTTAKRGEQVFLFPSKSAEIRVFCLLEIPLQQTLECLTVPGLVTGHLVHSVVDGVQTQLLGLLGDGHLAGGGAVLGYYCYAL